MLNSKLIRQIIPITILAVVLILAYWLDLGSSSTATKQCDLKKAVCIFRLPENEELRVEFKSVPLTLEDEIPLIFDLPNGIKFKSAWIEGVNMFMGKMRVIQQKQEQIDNTTRIHAITFLGACSEPQMRWRMIVELQKEGQESSSVAGKQDKQRYFVNFSTTI